MTYKTFIFDSYNFDLGTKTLTLRYKIDEAFTFTEKYKFDFDFAAYDETILDTALQDLFIMAGVSYYKTFVPSVIDTRNVSLNKDKAEFFGKTYQKGLGEFFYVNKLDPNTNISFPHSQHVSNPIASTYHGSGLLIGIGGGKDSLVTAEILKDQPKVATWSLNHRNQLAPLVEKIGLQHFWVERDWDKQLVDLNKADAYNGHIPISAIIACVGTVVAILAGYKDVIVSNENSANEATLVYKNTEINHQYSKSLDFEKAYQKNLHQTFGESGPNYYSFLRPLSEIHIAQLFCELAISKYIDVFSSCNRAFTHNSNSIWWCGSCAKCAFTCLALAPFCEESTLTRIWGKNLLTDQNLEEMYKNLLGISGEKPLDCVGEIKESRTAMRMAGKKYPELTQYSFEIPSNYDYLALAPHAMPEKIYNLLLNAL